MSNDGRAPRGVEPTRDEWDNASIGLPIWNDDDIPSQKLFEDGRMHAPVYGSPGGFWVQRTKRLY